MGSKTDPCGTPDEIINQLEQFQSIKTVFFLFDNRAPATLAQIPKLHN